MQQFIDKYGDQISGVLSGFDRLVFRGSLLRLNYGRWNPALKAVVAGGMEEYLWRNKILFKHYADHVHSVSERLKAASLEPFRQRGLSVISLRLARTDKDAFAREEARKKGITSGLVCAISSVETNWSFEHRGTNMIRRERASGALYHYMIHPEAGWAYARIQTWFPFQIQIGINGREWLARQMDREGLKYRQQGNCFTWIEDYKRAQHLLDQQLKTNWAELLQSFAGLLNPVHDRIFERYPASYYWTCHQSEWATDLVFRDAHFLKRLMSILVSHGMLSFSSVDVLRYFGKRVNQSGTIPANCHRTLQTNLKQYQEGERVKYSLDGNTAKFYDKAYSEVGSVLRAAETTINRVEPFKEYRTTKADPDGHVQWRPLRKGIAGLYRRAQISQSSNARLMDALASADDSRRVEELTRSVHQPTKWKDRRVRALRPWGDDKELLTAINDGDFFVNGFRNRDLQAVLYSRPADDPTGRRRCSAAISRKLRMLRAHGVIQKVPHSHRYHVTAAGRAIIVAVLTTARISVNQLNRLESKAA